MLTQEKNPSEHGHEHQRDTDDKQPPGMKRHSSLLDFAIVLVVLLFFMLTLLHVLLVVLFLVIHQSPLG
jgi:hypothetical protein